MFRKTERELEFGRSSGSCLRNKDDVKDDSDERCSDLRRGSALPLPGCPTGSGRVGKTLSPIVFTNEAPTEPEPFDVGATRGELSGVAVAMASAAGRKITSSRSTVIGVDCELLSTGLCSHCHNPTLRVTKKTTATSESRSDPFILLLFP